MLETVSTLEIGAGPADDAVAGGIRIPAAVPGVVSAAVHGVGIAPAADGSARCSYSNARRRLAIHRPPISMAADGGVPGSKTRAAGEFIFACVRIGGGPLRQC